MNLTDLRLIEAGFPCHQVGAETQRERGASSALPPLYFLHVWWARRPLTPSRAAILASLLPADTDPDWFLRQLGIEKVQALINGVPWTLTEDTHFNRITKNGGAEVFTVDRFAVNWIKKEQDRRAENRELIAEMISKNPSLAGDSVITRWQEDSKAIPLPLPEKGDELPVQRVAADPAWFNALMDIARRTGIRVPNLYGYDRAYTHHALPAEKPLVVLDPTAGGGSIPFEALRLGHKVIANDLNPVATVIQYATLDYPARFGPKLADDIAFWGKKLIEGLEAEISDLFPRTHPIPECELTCLKSHLARSGLSPEPWSQEETMTYLYVRQVTCPHCGGEAPLLNSCWLSKVEGDEWGVAVVPDGRAKGGKVQFKTYRCVNGKGPNGEDPEFATVYRGDGTCIHCKQKVDGEEIKKQARGESDFGKWIDRLFCVVAIRRQPKLDKQGKPVRGSDQEIKTEKVSFFRSPNATDLDALAKADKRFADSREQLEQLGLIPTEEIPPGHRSLERDIIFQYGMKRWTDMFTPRQLLGHAALIKCLKANATLICDELGDTRGRAVLTYLQFAIDKGLDYNSKQTRWHYSRGVLINTFGRHDFSLKWTFGEMIFSGPTSGSRWGLEQVVDAYKGIAALVEPLHQRFGENVPISITNGSAAALVDVNNFSVDLVCFDPPYYNNVQYAELSDFFYVWDKWGLQDAHPELFSRRLTNKDSEAVANPARDGSDQKADARYEELMEEIFRECARVLKDDGRLMMMFTHKSQDAWNALTKALIESGWVIASSFPVDSETEEGLHTKTTASAITSVFITCRKRTGVSEAIATWTGLGGTGVQQRIQSEVLAAMKEFEKLRLNPVDEMVAGYGRALRVLSEQWPVLDGDDPVSPTKAMAEASRVVAQYQITRLTGGRLQVNDLIPEAAVALTLYGIYGLGEIPFDDFRNLCNSLGIERTNAAAGYTIEGRMVGINADTQSRRRGGSSQEAEATGYHAPLISKGNKLRLAKPDERSAKRLEKPQTEWDILHGLLDAYTRGELVVARDYLTTHAGDRRDVILDLLTVWAKEMPDEKLRKDAETLLFGLKSS
jgi:adenine-specific DNA methylase